MVKRSKMTNISKRCIGMCLGVLVAALAVGIAGCGNDSNSGQPPARFDVSSGQTTPIPTPTPVPTPAVSLSGTATQGPMRLSTVTAYAVNSTDGSNIKPALADTTTNRSGRFKLAIPPQSGPVRLTVRGGRFKSEMNGAAIGAPATVSLLLGSASTNLSGLSVNPLSTFVDSRTVGLLAGGGTTFDAALSQATVRIENIYGLSTDPGSLMPDYTTTDSDAANLGLILGAIINEDQFLCPSAPGGLVTALAADIADGVFDGKGPGGAPISYCGGELPAIAGITGFQDALSGLNQLANVTGAFVFGGSGNILTTNGLADLATGGSTAYPVAPLATIDSAILQAAPAPVDSFAASGGPAMNVARTGATATLLRDGEVLIAGGGPSSAELYDPINQTFTPTTNSMSSVREEATATLLPNGEVLIAGGGTGLTTGPTNSADLYDPATGKFTASANSMTTGRVAATATLLPDGDVLIAGGGTGSGPTISADLYNPATDTFTPTANSMITARESATATLLLDGEVLIAGGYNASLGPTSGAELYDPVNQTFTATANSMSTGRFGATATLLPNGEVLIAGGGTSLTTLTPTSSAELYDPSTGKFTSTSNSMSSPRLFATATLLPNGEVLVAGGLNGSTTVTSSADLYDPATGKFTATSNSMTTGRFGAAVTLLPNGEVLIAGGANALGAVTSSTDIYTP